MIKKENKRISVTISKTIFKKLQDEAEYEGRSIGNMAAFIIMKYYKDKCKSKENK